MNASTSYAILATLAIVGSLVISPALAQSPILTQDAAKEVAESTIQSEIPVTVQTNEQTYDHDSVIMVEGSVGQMKSGTPVTVTVFSPINNLIETRQLDVSNNMFETTFNTAGSLWKYDGIYTIRVQYGESASDRTTVELVDGITREPTPVMVECDSDEFGAADLCIPYTITGGTVIKGEINPDSMSIVVMIVATDDGTFTMMPADGVIEGAHTVLVDDQEWDDVEIEGNEITVSFYPGAEKIEVIGTSVIPEFGTIATLILAAAIISIIAVTSRSRLNIMPRY